MPLTAGGVVFRRCRSRHEQAHTCRWWSAQFFQFVFRITIDQSKRARKLPIDQSIFLNGRSFQKSETIHVHTDGLGRLLEAEMAGTKGTVGKNSV